MQLGFLETAARFFATMINLVLQKNIKKYQIVRSPN